MSSSNDKNPSNKSTTNFDQAMTSTSEDEIMLIDYLKILWKHKQLILIGSILPTLVTGLIFFYIPRDYKATYTYEMGLNEKDYKTLLDKFYSSENLDRVIYRLKENNCDKYAQLVREASLDKLLKKLVDFKVSPSFFETMETLKTTDIKNIKEIQNAEGTLLTMAITGRPIKDMPKITSIIRNNFEKIIPMYSVKQGLNTTIINLKDKMANIEENRYNSELELKMKKAILTKLKSLKPEESGKIDSDIILQFENLDRNSAYLPLTYQIQAIESIIIELEETIKNDEENYKYYKELLNMNEKLYNEITKKASPYYTIQQFHPFLVNIVNDYTDKELTDYLSAYIKKIENTMSENTPIIEEPNIYPVSKGTTKTSSIVFVISLMATTFAAFMFEAIKEGRFRT
jgi:hypothetical protein